MARAHRHFIPGYAWHITHRCHKREFLLKFAQDRKRWLQWLFEAKRRYGLVILDYTITSNHIHILVHDVAGKDAIAKSIQLAAGRTGQEYNRRKKRKGAYWEDRYHATIVEDGDHLLRCIVYIDLNMVRAGVVEHPEQWPYGGYLEIQNPRRKCRLIDYDTLGRLAGFSDFSAFQVAHHQWVLAEMKKNNHHREAQWTEAVAVGSQSFVGSIKKRMGCLAQGRQVRNLSEGCELRDDMASYNGHLVAENRKIAPKKAPFT